MNLLLAFPVFLKTRDPVQGTENIVAMDLFVLIHIGLLLFLLGFFGCWAWLLWRRSTHPEPHHKLLMELEEELHPSHQQGPSTGPAEDSAPRPAWERDSDWWKH